MLKEAWMREGVQEMLEREPGLVRICVILFQVCLRREHLLLDRRHGSYLGRLEDLLTCLI